MGFLLPSPLFLSLNQILLVCLGGIFAGLTLGLLSLDTVHLNVLAEAGKNDNERTQAKTVLRLFEGGGRHTLLVVLLLGEFNLRSRSQEAGVVGRICGKVEEWSS